MANIHDRWREDVRGTVIGDILLSGVLMYEDRPQTQNITAKTEKDLVVIAKKKKDRIELELGFLFSQTYPQQNWWVKIYNY